ncbi:unnamed protein product [Parajaminaea phylloscopi]
MSGLPAAASAAKDTRGLPTSYTSYEDEPYATESYQSGSLQTQHAQSTSNRGDASWTPYADAGDAPPHHIGHAHVTQPDHASYATSQGISISNLCTAAWALPPFTGVLVLIFETTNDLARFHAYQSALCGVATILLLYVMRSWFGWYTLSVIAGMAALGASWVAGSNAHKAAPTLAKVPYLPYVGPLAEEWVGTE